MTGSVEFPIEQLAEVARRLDEIVVSLDRIGSRWADDPEGDAERVRGYVDGWDVFRSLARCRYLIHEVVDAHMDVDDFIELMGTSTYWPNRQPDQ